MVYGKHRLEDFGVTFVTTVSYSVSLSAIGYNMSYLKKMHREAAEVSVRKWPGIRSVTSFFLSLSLI